MNAERLFPGMCDDSLEIFFHEDQNKLMAIKNGRIQDFYKLKKEDTAFLSTIIDNDEQLKLILEDWFPSDKTKQCEQLAKCRFGGLNHVADFCNGEAAHDYVQCNLRGICEGENLVCKALEYNGNKLSAKEIKAIQLMATDLKNLVICDELGIPEGSFNVFRTQLYVKLGNIKTKQELTRVGVELGIIAKTVGEHLLPSPSNGAFISLL